MRANILSIFIVVFYITLCYSQNINYDIYKNNENNKIIYPRSLRRRFAEPTPL